MKGGRRGIKAAPGATVDDHMLRATSSPATGRGYEQIKNFYEYPALRHLLMMMQAGFLSTRTRSRTCRCSTTRSIRAEELTPATTRRDEGRAARIVRTGRTKDFFASSSPEGVVGSARLELVALRSRGGRLCVNERSYPGPTMTTIHSATSASTASRPIFGRRDGPTVVLWHSASSAARPS